jgi:signal transduction histidine kinase
MQRAKSHRCRISHETAHAGGGIVNFAGRRMYLGMVGKLDVMDIVTNAARRLESRLTYAFPFAILCESVGIIFESSKFLELKCMNSDISEKILEIFNREMRILEHTTIDSAIHTITLQKIATTCEGSGLFLAYLTNKKQVSMTDTDLILSKHYHDIQGPIRNIANLLEMIKMSLGESSYDKTHTYIGQAMRTLSGLSKLNFSLLPQESMEFIDIDMIINDIRSLSYNLLQKSCTKVIIDRNIPKLNGKYSDILRVFKNLIENSVKYAEVTPLIIKIKLLSVNAQSISIIFGDNGRPLSSECKKLIMSLLENGVDIDGHRFGLGICSEIMHKYSGSIKLLERKRHCSYELTFVKNSEDSNAAT